MFFLDRFLSESLRAQEEARKAFKVITEETRPLSPSSLGAYAIAEASPSSFIFYSNIDSDPLKERVRYFLDGTVLKRGIIKPSGDPLSYNPDDETTSEIIHNVANDTTPLFSYYDSDYDGTTPPLGEPVNVSSVRLVKITVLIDKNPSQPPAAITMATQVSMRNLKDNL